MDDSRTRACILPGETIVRNIESHECAEDLDGTLAPREPLQEDRPDEPMVAPETGPAAPADEMVTPSRKRNMDCSLVYEGDDVFFLEEGSSATIGKGGTLYDVAKEEGLDYRALCSANLQLREEGEGPILDANKREAIYDSKVDPDGSKRLFLEQELRKDEAEREALTKQTEERFKGI